MQILFSKLSNISNSTKDKTNEFYEWILYLMNFRLSLYFLRIEILRIFAWKKMAQLFHEFVPPILEKYRKQLLSFSLS